MRARHQVKLDELKQHCDDTKEVNRINCLANQSGGIREYLEELNKVGVTISMVRLKSLEDDKARYLKELDELDVVDIDEADFQVTPPQNAEPTDTDVASPAANLDQYGSHMPSDRPAEESSNEYGDDDDEEEEEEEEDSGRLTTKKRTGREDKARDPSTGEELAPLDFVPVLPTNKP